MRTAVVVPAAGRGERLGPGGPKALRLLAGQPLLVHALRRLAAAPDVSLVVVVAPADDEAAVRATLAMAPAGCPLLVVPGGADRVASVAAGLAALPDDIDVVLVHDAARPLVPTELVTAVAAAVRAGADAVVPGLVPADTVKQVDDAGRVVGTPERSALRAIQTPQGFRRAALARAHAAAAAVPPGERAALTDDAGLCERIGVPVLVVPGAPEAFKVTRPVDLLLAEALLAAAEPATTAAS